MPFALKAPCGRGDATRQRHCDWRFCPLHAEAEKLFLLTSVEPHASAASLRLFLSHYSQLGLRLATHAQVVLHADARRNTDWLGTLALLAEFGVRKPAVVASPLSPSSRRSLTNAFLRQLPPDAALLSVGLEELVHFRCGARGLAARASICGLLANHEGSAPLPARGGYRLCERTQLRVGAEFKYVLLPARLHGGAVREGRNLTRVTRHGLVYAASEALGRMDTQPLPCEWAALVLTPARVRPASAATASAACSSHGEAPAAGPSVETPRLEEGGGHDDPKVVYTSLRPAGSPGVREQGLLHSLRRVGLDAPLRLKTFGFRVSDKSDAITADAAGSLSRALPPSRKLRPRCVAVVSCGRNADLALLLAGMRFCQALLKNSSGQPFLDSEAFLPAPLEATGIELQPLQPRLGLDPVVLLANCTPAMPECCVFPSYRGSSTKKYPCAHSDAYDQGDWVNGLRVVSWSWSVRSCSAQVGHTLSFLEGLRLISELHTVTPGFYLFLEDDARPHPNWRHLYKKFLRAHPPSTWHLAKLTGGGVGPQHANEIERSRRVARDLFLGGPTTMFSITNPPWGNAALLLHSANASFIHDMVTKWERVHNLDWSLMGAHALGWMTMVASDDVVFTLSQMGRMSTLN